MVEVGIGLGSNLGDRCGNIIAALKALELHPSIELTRASSIYETPPWGMTEQPAFLNAAALVETTLTPDELLGTCKEIERALGRTIRHRWGPREVDIDLLFFGDVSIATEALTLPHPRLFERMFVLIPLCEIAQDRRVADRDLTIALAQLGQVELASDIRLDIEATERLQSFLAGSDKGA
jgi:2-amino-4-hydroxy-6-hydroxymethyldihydropteridine diphosphokinase